MAASLTEEELRELERWADEFDEAASDPECGEHPEVRRRMRRICLLSKKAVAALRALTATAEPTAAPSKGSDVIESHEAFDARLEDAGLRWVRYPNSWELGWSGVATVWPNGVWHTWDARGIGGQNASEGDVAAAKRVAEAALFEQDAHPIKGWRSHGFDQLEPVEDESEDTEPTAGEER